MSPARAGKFAKGSPKAIPAPYEGGLPSASHVGVIADAAQAADAPGRLRRRPAPGGRAASRVGNERGEGQSSGPGRVADRLDVVAVRVADEGAVVVGWYSGQSRGSCRTSAPVATAASKKARDRGPVGA